jgi:hypothetical protein
MNRIALHTATAALTLATLAVSVTRAHANDHRGFGRAGTVSLSSALAFSDTSMESSIESSDGVEGGSVERFTLTPTFGYFALDVLQLKAGLEIEREEKNIDDAPDRSEISLMSVLLGAEVDVPIDDARRFFVTGVFDVGTSLTGDLEERVRNVEIKASLSQKHARLGAGLTLAFGSEMGGFVSILVSKRWVEREASDFEFDDDSGYVEHSLDRDGPSIKAWPHRLGVDGTIGLYF